MKPFEVTLEKGLSAKMEFTVGEKDTAKYYGSGKSEILATPALVRYMEATAQKIVDTGIPHDWQSIGTFFSVEHNSALHRQALMSKSMPFLSVLTTRI